MKKRTTLLILTIFCFLAIFAQTKNSFTTIDKTHKPYQYALLYTNMKGKLCILGKHAAGTSVILLNIRKSTVIACKAVAVKTEVNEIGDDFTFTTLNKQFSKKEIEELLPEAILKTTVKEFELLYTISENDNKSITEIDRAIKKGKYLDKIMRQDEDTKTADMYLDSLKSKLPNIYNIQLEGADLKVVEYTIFLDPPAIGPRFLMINSKIIPLTGQCSGNTVFYRFGGNYFVSTSSNCCECGWAVDQVFEIRNDRIIKEFADGSFSM